MLSVSSPARCAAAARAVVELLQLDRPLIVPAGLPPHKELPARTPTPEQRLELIRRSVADLPNVEAELYSGLLADYARQKGAGLLVTGVRNTTDFDLEYQQEAINRGICPELEKLMLLRVAVLGVGCALVSVLLCRTLHFAEHPMKKRLTKNQRPLLLHPSRSFHKRRMNR